MDRIYELFLEAVGAALNGRQVAWENVSSQEWNELFRLSASHQVLPMFLEAVYACPAIGSMEPAALAAIRREVRVQVMGQARKTMEFLQLYPKLTMSGVSALVVKGIICRSLYPQPDHRPSGDEDVLIDPSRYVLCKEIFRSCGFVPIDENAETNDSYEVPFGKPGNPLHIELHKHLFPPQSEAYGDFVRFFQDVHTHPMTVNVMGVEVMTMAPTDHLFYLICHAFKHFLHSGFGIRQVCDIMLFANKYGSQIHWDQVYENCQAIRADRFAAALFRIGKLYLTFEPEKACYPSSRQLEDIDCQPLLLDLLCGGIYGDADMSRKHSSNITLDAVAAQKQGKKARGSLISSLFPPAKSLSGRYPYLKNKPWLLPVAWTARIVSYGAKGQSESNNAAESLKIGSRRVELMKEYGIIE